MTTPAVTRILVEYADGSVDEIKTLQLGDMPLYGLRRQRPGVEAIPGAYTGAAIASLLFATAATTMRTEYSLQDPKRVALVHSWFGKDVQQLS